MLKCRKGAFMKNFFALRKDGNGVAFDHILRRVSTESETRLEENQGEINRASNKANPKWLQWVTMAFTVVSAVILSGILEADVSIKEVYHSKPALIYVCGVCGVIAIVLWCIIIYRTHKLKKDPAFQNSIEKANNSVAACKLELGIPLNAVTMDVLCPPVRVNKNGEEKRRTFVNGNTCANLVVDVFEEDGKLCFADTTYVFAVPMSTVKSITKVKKWVTIPTWNKEEKINSKAYKPYKLMWYEGNITMRWHYQVIVEIGGEQCEILIPNYEIDNFRKIVPLEIQDPKKKEKR